MRRKVAWAEDTAVTRDLATTFGIAFLSVNVFYGDVVSLLLRCGSGLGWGPKGLACISIFPKEQQYKHMSKTPNS